MEELTRSRSDAFDPACLLQPPTTFVLVSVNIYPPAKSCIIFPPDCCVRWRSTTHVTVALGLFPSTQSRNVQKLGRMKPSLHTILPKAKFVIRVQLRCWQLWPAGVSYSTFFFTSPRTRLTQCLSRSLPSNAFELHSPRICVDYVLPVAALRPLFNHPVRSKSAGA